MRENLHGSCSLSIWLYRHWLGRWSAIGRSGAALFLCRFLRWISKRNGGSKRCTRRSFDEAVSSVPVNRQDQNSSCKCDSLVCENFKSFEKKVHYLVKTVDKLWKGKSNFENVLASQNCVFGKAGLGFNPQSKFSKPLWKLLEKQPIEKSEQPVLHAFITWRETTLLDSTILGNLIFLKVFWNGFLRFLRFLRLLLTSLDPNS